MEGRLTPFNQLLTLQKTYKMNQLTRSAAIHEISMKKLTTLNTEIRESYILDWWGIDENDVEYFALSTELQNQILMNEVPPNDSENKEYDSLILVALASEFKGVTNHYLSETLVTMELGIFYVSGDIELLEACPCCNYRTLDSRGSYDI